MGKVCFLVHFRIGYLHLYSWTSNIFVVISRVQYLPSHNLSHSIWGKHYQTCFFELEELRLRKINNLLKVSLLVFSRAGSSDVRNDFS